ncbi:Phosphoinositide phosphatase sac1, partial [Coemansia aciculifera]
MCSAFYQSTVVIEAARGAGDERLVIDRDDGAVTSVLSSVATPAFAAAPQRTITAHGIMGIINLLRGPYLVLITGREVVGSIGSSTVYRASEIRVVKAATDSRVLSGTDAFDEVNYLRLLDSALAV